MTAYYVWHGTTYCEHHLPTVALGAASRFEGSSIPTCAECPGPEFAAGGLVAGVDYGVGVSTSVASWPFNGPLKPDNQEPTVVKESITPSPDGHLWRERHYSDGMIHKERVSFHKEIPLEAVDLLLRRHFAQES